MAKCPKCNEKLSNNNQFFIRPNSTIICNNCNYKVLVDSFSCRLVSIVAAILIFLPPILADIYLTTENENLLLILRVSYIIVMLMIFLTFFPRLIIKISVSKTNKNSEDV